MKRFSLPLLGGLFVLSTISAWHVLWFVSGVALVVVIARLGYSAAERELEWRQRRREARYDVAALVERYSFPGDPVDLVIARLRGTPVSEARSELEALESLRTVHRPRRHR